MLYGNPYAVRSSTSQVALDPEWIYTQAEVRAVLFKGRPPHQSPMVRIVICAIRVDAMVKEETFETLEEARNVFEGELAEIEKLPEPLTRAYLEDRGFERIMD